MDYLHIIKNIALKGEAGTDRDCRKALMQIVGFINHEEQDYALRLKYYEERAKRSGLL